MASTAAAAALAQQAPRRCLHVAVIGAGAAGLAATRELLREGHVPTVFEQGHEPGGVWVYSDQTDADRPLGALDTRRRAHSSMYVGLRTNLPRELMGFADFPFTPAAMDAAAGRGASVDPRRFPSHREVLAYLRAFSRHHRLQRHVRFGTRVLRAVPIWGATASADEDGSAAGDDDAPVTSGSGPRWSLTLEVEGGGSGRVQQQQQDFDALVVCNGHYTATNLPVVEGQDVFPGQQLHSHNYRSPAPYSGQTVLIVGASNSGEDLCREVADVAARVLICARSWKNAAWGTDDTPFGPRGNIERRGMVCRLRADGGAEFETGADVGCVDAVIYATGYRYEFPFLEGTVVDAEEQSHPGEAAANGGCGGGGGAEGMAQGRAAPREFLSTRDQRVSPLYAHMFFPPLAPSLAFIGLPWKVVPFPQFELQSRLVARLLSGRASLPSRRAMRGEAAAWYARLQEEGVPPRWTHLQGDQQWEYNDWLVAVARPSDGAGGADDAPLDAPLPAWRSSIYSQIGASKRAHPDDYRDRWDDGSRDKPAAFREAEEELRRLEEEVMLLGTGRGAAAAAADAEAEAAAPVL